jgi:hypothetical protein
MTDLHRKGEGDAQLKNANMGRRVPDQPALKSRPHRRCQRIQGRAARSRIRDRLSLNADEATLIVRSELRDSS